MSPRTLLALFDSVYLIALAAWVGSILFFSFGVAPVIFKALSAESAAKFVRALFPRYYAWGAVAGAVALPAYLAGPLTFPEYRGPWVGVQALLILGATLVMFYCGQSLTPAINAARDAGDGARERFARLHRRSVRLNSLVLVVGLGLIVAHAFRPAPSSTGVIELTGMESPGERLRRLDREIDRLKSAEDHFRDERAGLERQREKARAVLNASGGP